MSLYKSAIRLLCKPPASMKGDYKYAERKYLNISILFQIFLSFVPPILSIFIDIDYNAKRLIILIPMYTILVLLMYLRCYQLVTISIQINIFVVLIDSWMSTDRGAVFCFPFFSLIISATFVPSRKFLAFGYIFIFSVSYFIIEKSLIEFLQNASKEEIMQVFRKSFTSMPQILTMSFCHLLLGRYIQEKVYENLLSLKTTVATQNQELQKVNFDLKKALESRESFILSFSHETRNPLNGIIGNLALLSEVDLSSKKARGYLQKTNICAKLLNNILLTILDSRRTGQSAIDIHLKHQTIDMSIFIREIWTLCREIIRSKDIIPILDVSPRLPRWLVFDSERITQVVMNLASNAMKFTQKGYIKVVFDWKTQTDQTEDNSETSKTIFFTSYKAKMEKEFEQENEIYSSGWFQKPATEEKGLLLISIEDTGCGISENNQKIIFDKFSQVSEKPELKMLGLGLGLWISKAIINLHEGDILLKSKEGVGSCFTATISTTSKPSDQVEQAIPFPLSLVPKDRAIQKKPFLRALVVDDVPINQDINSEMLKKYGFTSIEVALNGQEAFTIFKEGDPNYFDLVTMDLEMPIMKGKEAMTLMRRWETENKVSPTKIIVISGNVIEKEVNECLDVKGKIRADAFLAKPCSYNTLAETVRRLEDESRGSQSLQKKGELSADIELYQSAKDQRCCLLMMISSILTF